MLVKISKDITFFFVRNRLIEIEESETYEYGLQVILSTLFVGIILLIVALIMNEVTNLLIYVSVFGLLRPYTGGYHSKTLFGCSVISNLIFLTIVVSVRLLPVGLWFCIGAAISILSTVIIFFKAPVIHEYNQICKLDVVKFKRNSRIMSTLILCVIFVLSIFFKYFKATLTLCLSLFAISSMMIMPSIKKGGVYSEEINSNA